MVRRIFKQQTTAFKINLSFGFILRNVETGELRYYHSSQNNSRLLWRTFGWSREWRSLHHFWSLVESPVTEHAFPSIKILTTNGTGDRVVVGFLVAFSVVCPSPGPSKSPPKQPRSHSPQSSNSPSVESNILPEEPETRILYLRHSNMSWRLKSARNISRSSSVLMRCGTSTNLDLFWL
jgi:hypothetical protein